MERLEPTRRLALVIWWAFAWRTVLFAAGLGLIMGNLLKAFAIHPHPAVTVVGFAGLAAAAFEAFYRVLRLRFSSFELALLKHKES